VDELPKFGPEVDQDGNFITGEKYVGDKAMQVHKTNERVVRPFPAIDVVTVKLREPWGIEFSPRSSNLGAVVSSISPKGSAFKALPRIEPESMLLRVNSDDCRLRVYTSVQRVLERARDAGPITTFQLLPPRFIQGGKHFTVRLPLPLGVALEDVGDADEESGVRIAAVTPNGHAHQHGNIRVNMRVRSINDLDATRATVTDVYAYLSKLDKTKPVTLELASPYYIIGKTKTFKLILPLGLGLEEDNESGDVYVMEVGNHTQSYAAGIRKWMVIRGINGVDVSGMGMEVAQAEFSKYGKGAKLNVSVQLLRSFGSSSVTVKTNYVKRPKPFKTIIKRPLGLVLVNGVNDDDGGGGGRDGDGINKTSTIEIQQVIPDTFAASHRPAIQPGSEITGQCVCGCV